MNTNRIKKAFMGAAVALVLLVGVGSTTANAQGRVIVRPRPIIIYRHHNPFWYRHYDPFWNPFWGPGYTYVDPIVAQRESGYSDGKSRGKDDAKKGLANNPASHKHYIKSNSLAYREAFVQGYNEGYQDKLADIRKDRDKNGD